MGEDLSTTIIDGNGNGSVVTFMNDHQVLYLLYIQNGNAIPKQQRASTFGASGDGIRMKETRPVLKAIA